MNLLLLQDNKKKLVLLATSITCFKYCLLIKNKTASNIQPKILRFSGDFKVIRINLFAQIQCSLK